MSGDVSCYSKKIIEDAMRNDIISKVPEATFYAHLITFEHLPNDKMNANYSKLPIEIIKKINSAYGL